VRARARGTTRTDRHHERSLPLRRGDGHARAAGLVASHLRCAPATTGHARRAFVSRTSRREPRFRRADHRARGDARAPRRSRPRRGVGKSGSPTAALCA